MLSERLSQIHEFLQSGCEYYSTRQLVLGSVRLPENDLALKSVQTEREIALRLAIGYRNALRGFEDCQNDVASPADLPHLRGRITGGIMAADREGEYEIRDLLLEIATLIEHLPEYPPPRDKPIDPAEAAIASASSKEKLLELLKQLVAKRESSPPEPLPPNVVTTAEFASGNDSLPHVAPAGRDHEGNASIPTLRRGSMLVRMARETRDWVLVVLCAALIAAAVLYSMLR